jgi:DNA-binding winged helix-turn-helix (wHTH) protein
MIPRIKHIPNDQELRDLIHGGVMVKMKANAFTVFSYLCTQQYFDEPVSMEKITRQLGLPEEAVTAAFNRLIKLGYAEEK